MKELVAALIVALSKKPVSTDHATNLETARQIHGDINVSDGEKWVTLFTKEEVDAVLSGGVKEFNIGDKVEAEVKGEWKQGVIKTQAFQVEGLGNKFYSPEDLVKINE